MLALMGDTILGSLLFPHSFARIGFSLPAGALTLELPSPLRCHPQMDLFSLPAGASRLGLLLLYSGVVSMEFLPPLRSSCCCFDSHTSALDIVNVGSLLLLQVLSYPDLSPSSTSRQTVCQTAHFLSALDFAWLDALASLKNLALGFLLLVLEHSKPEPMPSPHRSSKTGPVPSLSMSRVGMSAVILDAFGMAAPLVLQRSVKLEASLPVFRTTCFGSFMLLHGPS
eukprot:s3069_g6.t1